MQSPLRPRNWIIFILVNIFISAVTAFIVVRALTQAANRPLLEPPSPAAVAQAPTQMPADSPAAVASTQALPEATAIPPDAAATAQVEQPLQPLQPLQPTDQPTQEATAAPAAAPAATALPATSAAPANVRISTVVYPGQRTREAVVIVNEGDQVDMTGWTLTNPRSVTYTFGSVLLFKESFINLHTTSGVDVPTDLFWNRDEAVWQQGDVATLKRGDEVMATFTVQ